MPLKDDASTLQPFWKRAVTSIWNSASRTNSVPLAGHSSMGSPAGSTIFTSTDTSFSTLRFEPQ